LWKYILLSEQYIYTINLVSLQGINSYKYAKTLSNSNISPI
jgi:hypothetical protein